MFFIIFHLVAFSKYIHMKKIFIFLLLMLSVFLNAQYINLNAYKNNGAIVTASQESLL
ncbi:hypothetical protein LWM68_31660 [Niabella sp. W65]|nr:hypothetical protein [Niabella sp. W65]MCH7366923.1 hypothetical protein [Niabella sp. W65]